MGSFRSFLLLAFLLITGGVAADDGQDATALFNRIRSLDVIVSLQPRDVSKGFWGSLSCSAECSQAIELKNELKVRAETDPAASFYTGLLALERAQLFRRADTQSEIVESESKEARARFGFASRAGIAPASWNMGIIYDSNLGVAGSKLAAIEWFARAGHQYLSDGERETALAALEKIEALDPKHPESKRLRDALYPPKRKY
jgi:TPR repeat protein